MSGYREALDALHRLERFGIRLGLEEMRAICAASGHPERSAPTLHVGGTNGKGTTAAVLSALGTAHGLRTGCYTSPHVLDFRERIRIDGEPIPEDAVGEAYRAGRPAVGAPERGETDRLLAEPEIDAVDDTQAADRHLIHRQPLEAFRCAVGAPDVPGLVRVRALEAPRQAGEEHHPRADAHERFRGGAAVRPLADREVGHQ